MLELSIPSDDGHAIMEVGGWASDKHHFLRRYIDAFTIAMKNKPWPGGLHYIDLFAGSGIQKVKPTGELIWGSPLIAAQCSYFDSIHLCDIDIKYISALKARIQALGAQKQTKIYCGDANKKVSEIVKSLPQKSLSLAFLDPFGLHLHLSTIKVLATRRVDLIIFFPDYLDAVRNWKKYYKDKLHSNPDDVFGPSADWRGLLESTPENKIAEALRDLYVEQIRMIGYTKFAYERISARGTPLYLLIFCSHHRAGLIIWENISRTKPDGQRTWF